MFLTDKLEQHLSVIKRSVEEKILQFKNLPNGWHYGSGNRPSDETIEQAILIFSRIQSYQFTTEALPGIDGQIQLLCSKNDYTLEINLEIDNTITFIAEENNEELEYIEGLSLLAALNQIGKYGRLCNLSESSIHTIISDRKSGSAAWRLKTPQMEAEYQLY